MKKTTKTKMVASEAQPVETSKKTMNNMVVPLAAGGATLVASVGVFLIYLVNKKNKKVDLKKMKVEVLRNFNLTAKQAKRIAEETAKKMGKKK